MSETNTLVAYKLPKERIHDVVSALDAQHCVGLVRCIELPFLRRVLAVFDSIDAAKAAFAAVTATVASVAGANARVGYSMARTDSLADPHLRLPDPGRLLLISPPASPPTEWRESLEEQPNQRTHYEEEFNKQLSDALRAVAETPGTSPVPDSPHTITIVETGSKVPGLQVTTSI